jgi:hypothetical protein
MPSTTRDLNLMQQCTDEGAVSHRGAFLHRGGSAASDDTARRLSRVAVIQYRPQQTSHRRITGTNTAAGSDTRRDSGDHFAVHRQHQSLRAACERDHTNASCVYLAGCRAHILIAVESAPKQFSGFLIVDFSDKWESRQRVAKRRAAGIQKGKPPSFLRLPDQMRIQVGG